LKKVVSVSLGSSKRDHTVQVTLLGEEFTISRMGTDGDYKKALSVLADLDGKVDAIGLGGIDIYLHSKHNRYALRDGLRLKEAVKTTPVVDGSGLKNTLEREVIKHIAALEEFPLKDRKVLMVCAMDRFGMAEAFTEAGCRMVYGDLIFALGLDKPITSLEELEETADKLLPEVTKLPIGFLYPIGKKQESKPEEKYTKYYQQAEIIAGDYHFIRRYMPRDMAGKIIITNTTTAQDVEELKVRGVRSLVTTTPEFEGRSFGTNVLEAAFIVLLGKSWDDVTPEDYLGLIRKLGLRPRIEHFSGAGASVH
jgi:hypothetical protein